MSSMLNMKIHGKPRERDSDVVAGPCGLQVDSGETSGLHRRVAHRLSCGSWEYLPRANLAKGGLAGMDAVMWFMEAPKSQVGKVRLMGCLLRGNVLFERTTSARGAESH